jgi:hypothetical protein
MQFIATYATDMQQKLRKIVNSNTLYPENLTLGEQQNVKISSDFSQPIKGAARKIFWETFIYTLQD